MICTASRETRLGRGPINKNPLVEGREDRGATLIRMQGSNPASLTSRREPTVETRFTACAIYRVFTLPLLRVYSYDRLVPMITGERLPFTGPFGPIAPPDSHHPGSLGTRTRTYSFRS